jgi:phosphate starvation-inducible PhoH-like protein
MAVRALRNKEVERIILVRPAVEAGEKLGFLPGDFIEKVNPYLRPLYDGLFDILGVDVTQRYMDKNIIEIAPLAFMRGRTLNNAFIILDEAQNTTPQQMKMFLTRLGFGSQTVITGDVTQVDLPRDDSSGLIEIQKILGGIKGISFEYLTKEDVVRHPLVQKIINAYELYNPEH